eukprot:TRINITY_DN4427_c0_g1_i1.p1 TRINITY_DN4427_c0_g1~~TRINITY_DN4427_c0_g1_i1.p1  ORF type:complete len:641 (+),score=79.35 TRINITY_DN4427_c0_g1_i1:120-2042(+)
MNTIETSSKAIELDIKNHELYHQRSEALFSRKLFDLALQDALISIILNPTWSKGYSCAGKAMLALGKFKHAISVLEKCLELDPNNPEAPKLLDDSRKLYHNDHGDYVDCLICNEKLDIVIAHDGNNLISHSICHCSPYWKRIFCCYDKKKHFKIKGKNLLISYCCLKDKESVVSSEKLVELVGVDAFEKYQEKSNILSLKLHGGAVCPMCTPRTYFFPLQQHGGLSHNIHHVSCPICKISFCKKCMSVIAACFCEKEDKVEVVDHNDYYYYNNNTSFFSDDTTAAITKNEISFDIGHFPSHESDQFLSFKFNVRTDTDNHAFVLSVNMKLISTLSQIKEMVVGELESIKYKLGYILLNNNNNNNLDIDQFRLLHLGTFLEEMNHIKEYNFQVPSYIYVVPVIKITTVPVTSINFTSFERVGGSRKFIFNEFSKKIIQQIFKIECPTCQLSYRVYDSLIIQCLYCETTFCGMCQCEYSKSMGDRRHHYHDDDDEGYNHSLTCTYSFYFPEVRVTESEWDFCIPIIKRARLLKFFDRSYMFLFDLVEIFLNNEDVKNVIRNEKVNYAKSDILDLFRLPSRYINWRSTFLKLKPSFKLVLQCIYLSFQERSSIDGNYMIDDVINEIMDIYFKEIRNCLIRMDR